MLRGVVPGTLFCLLAFAASSWSTTLGDIVYPRDVAPGDWAQGYFPHWVHRIKYKCYACHDSLYPMGRGPNPTMAAMARGASCGACHNGKQAFGVDMCQRCHVPQ